jgi:hypothetical protein
VKRRLVAAGLLLLVGFLLSLRVPLSAISGTASAALPPVEIRTLDPE